MSKGPKLPREMRFTYSDNIHPSSSYKNWINVCYYPKSGTVDVEWRSDGKTVSRNIPEQINFLEHCIAFLKDVEKSIKHYSEETK